MADENHRASGLRAGMTPRIAEAIAADLRQRILQSDQTDVPLPRQDDLVKQYGVSGPSVREALRILEAEGLITVRRGKFGGAFVHKPDWSSAAFAVALSMQGQGVRLSDLAESLVALEPLCVAECAARADRHAEIIPALRQNLAENESLIGIGDQFSARARVFHEIIVGGLQNQSLRLLVRTLSAVWSIQEQTWAQTVKAAAQYPGEDQQRESLRTHEVLTKLIDEGDAEGARRLAEKHLRATQQIVLDRHGDEVVDSSSLLAVQAFKSL
ncbi:FCD domain-containing protein [Microbacterium sp. zg.Y625]|uniref:FadR/GntR family transcriptional regulator n=1 Tax=Microbacterium jiangjiandongii TaxID=3049071 RepID=UPI00214C62AD|nr:MULTISPECIES: FCD domain-containing protein [unclassified Microbacterium]MCR2793460.1 FCD domain-containing protein [Microbacterium sp. zg.Y625]MCR2815362.1 FCD domain-containing protein [Microbacterium sp. zg.Y843]WIM25169.1 FCD domain-containing protein [Microbacterium sp. zg-Y625]